MNTVPDNHATCSVQVKFYISAIVQRAKEQTNYCVVKHLHKDSRREMNVSVCSTWKKVPKLSKTIFVFQK